jgi:uncharacterized membrane protein YozB (DUF420 family)
MRDDPLIALVLVWLAQCAPVRAAMQVTSIDISKFNVSYAWPHYGQRTSGTGCYDCDYDYGHDYFL